MDCETTQNLFTAYTDQELDSQEKLRLEGHLAACPQCAREWCYFQKTLHRLQAVEPLPVPPDLLPGIQARLRRPSFFQKLQQGFQWFTQPPLPAAASLFGAVLLVVLLINTGFQEGTSGLSDRQPAGSAPTQRLESPFTIPVLQVDSSNHPQADNKVNSLPVGHLPPRLSPPLLRRSTPNTNFHWVTTWTGHSPSFDPDFLTPPRHHWQIGTPLRPDVTIRIPNLSAEGLDHLYRQVKEENKWQARLYRDNYFVVLLNPEDLGILYGMLQQYHLPFVARPAAEGAQSGKQPLLIAIRP